MSGAAKVHGRLRVRAEGTFETFSTAVTRWTGSTWGFVAALAIALSWAGVGLVAGFSDNWLWAINIGTSAVTFLMVFLIQRAQNKDARAVQMKLDELLLALGGASNLLVNVEKLPEKDLDDLQRRFQALAHELEMRNDANSSHSVSESKPVPEEKKRETS